MLNGRIAEVGGGCVSVEVYQTIKRGASIEDRQGNTQFSGQAEPGELLRGRLGKVYAYDHGFEVDEDVAVVPEPWDDALSLSLFPRQGSSVALTWGRARGQATLEELAASTCVQTVQARLDPGSDTISHSNRDAPQAVFPTEPPPPPVDCGTLPQ